MSQRRSSSAKSSRRSSSASASPEKAGARRLLKERDIRPSYGMGQNFMTDANVAAWIVDQLRVTPEDTVIEIGPGMGALTEHLVKTPARRIILVEKDDRLVEVVREKFGGLPRVTVLHGDGVRLDTRPFFKERPVKILGALPYSCGTEIVRNVTRNPSPAERLVFTLQKEVCERLSAGPGEDHYGLLALRAQARWKVEFLRKLPPDIFVPRPAVDSGVIAMTPRPRPELPVFDEKLYDRLLAAGFSQRRKMLKNLLPPHPEGMAWEAMAEKLGVNPLARAQELTLRQWVDLTNLYDGHALKDNPQSGDEIFDVVDEENRVIRQESRRIVHRDNLWHRAVHVFALNRKGEVFLQLRSHLKDKMPEKWDSSAAGHLDAGEDYASAAVRELEEELGLRAAPGALTLAARVPAGPRTGWEFVELFTVSAWEGKPRWPASEIETGEWFAPEEIDAWTAARPEDFAEGFLECWRVWRGKMSEG